MSQDSVPPSQAVPAALPSIDDALAFVREHAPDARLSTGELLVEHAQGTAAIMGGLLFVLSMFLLGWPPRAKSSSPTSEPGKAVQPQ